MAAQPPKRSNSPEEKFDIETGMSMMKPISASPIEVKVETPPPVVRKPEPSLRQLSGPEVLAKAIGPGTFGRGKSRKQKKRAQKKTQKRRSKK